MAQFLPKLRSGLQINTLASKKQYPQWRIYDPLQNRHLIITTLQYEILMRWDMQHPSLICQDINKHSTLKASIDDVKHLKRLLSENHLTIQHHSNTQFYQNYQALQNKSHTISIRTNTLLFTILLYVNLIINHYCFANTNLTATLTYALSGILIAVLLSYLNPLIPSTLNILFSKWINVDDVRYRAQQHIRWLRQAWLYGCPNPKQIYYTVWQMSMLTIYCCYRWLYLLGLWLAAAVMSFYWLQPLLALVIIGVASLHIMIEPIIKDLLYCYKRYRHMKFTAFNITLPLLIVFIIGALLYPWQRYITVPATIRYQQAAAIILPLSATPQRIFVKPQQTVAAGAALAQLQRPASNQQPTQLVTLHAPFAGIITNINPLLSKNSVIAAHTTVITMLNRSHANVIANIPSYETHSLKIGEPVIFFNKSYTKKLAAHIAAINIQAGTITASLDQQLVAKIYYPEQGYLSIRGQRETSVNNLYRLSLKFLHHI